MLAVELCYTSYHFSYYQLFCWPVHLVNYYLSYAKQKYFC